MPLSASQPAPAFKWNRLLSNAFFVVGEHLVQDKSKEIRLSTLQFRLERTAARLIILRQIENRFPWYRLAALVLGLLATYLGFQLLPFYLAWAVLLVAMVVFVLITLQH